MEADSRISITAIRDALRLTRAQLARVAGVDQSTVWRWENEGVPKRGPARALLEILAKEAKNHPPEAA